MDQQTLIKISADKITDEIKPITHYGRIEKENFVLFDSSTKNELQDYLSLLNKTSQNLNPNNIDDINSILSSISNIKLILKKLQNSPLEVYEIFEVKKLIYHYNKLKKEYPNLPYIEIDLRDLFNLLNPENKSGYTFYVYDKYSQNLQLLRKKESKISKKIKDEESKIKNILKEKYDILFLSDEFVISKIQKDLIKEVLDSGLVLSTRETFSNMYFTIRKNDELNALYKDKFEVKKEIENEEKKVLKSLSVKLRNEIEKISQALKNIGKLDFLISKIEFIKKYEYCVPKINEDEFNFKNLSFVPMLKKSNYTPISTKIVKGLNILVGTNMGGKSTFLKTLGLAQFMLKYGLLLPAEKISMPLLDDIFFVNEDTESESLSSFATNIERLIKGLKKDKKTLLLIDEFAKGTNPIEGNALAKALADWIYNNRKDNFTIFATHFEGPVDKKYHLLKVGKIKKSFTNIYDAIDHSVSEYEGKFPMEALKISKFLGLNKKIIEKAKESIENDLS